MSRVHWGRAECHTPDLGNKSPEWRRRRRRVNRNEQRSSNERATAPPSVSAANDLGHMKTNGASERRPALWSVAKHLRRRSRPRRRPRPCSTNDGGFLCGERSSEREECADKQQLLLCVLSASAGQERPGSCRKPSLCLW